MSDVLIINEDISQGTVVVTTIEEGLVLLIPEVVIVGEKGDAGADGADGADGDASDIVAEIVAAAPINTLEENSIFCIIDSTGLILQKITWAELKILIASI